MTKAYDAAQYKPFLAFLLLAVVLTTKEESDFAVTPTTVEVSTWCWSHYSDSIGARGSHNISHGSPVSGTQKKYIILICISKVVTIMDKVKLSPNVFCYHSGSFPLPGFCFDWQSLMIYQLLFSLSLFLVFHSSHLRSVTCFFQMYSIFIFLSRPLFIN